MKLYYYLILAILMSIAANATNQYCFQETANISTICGGSALGDYTVYPNTDAIYINYYKPTLSFYEPNGVDGAIWQVKTRAYFSNLTIPSECFNAHAHVLALRLRTYEGSNLVAIAECESLDGWLTLKSQVYGGVRPSGSPDNRYDKVYDENYSSGAIFIGPPYNGWTSSSSGFIMELYEEGIYWYQIDPPTFNITFPVEGGIYNYTDVPIRLNGTRGNNLTWCGYTEPELEPEIISIPLVVVNGNTTCADITGHNFYGALTSVTIFANDTQGRQSNITIHFGADNYAPGVGILSPLEGNAILQSDNISIYAYDYNISSCVWSIDGGLTNYSIAECIHHQGNLWKNISYSWPVGNSKFQIWVTDWAGNINQSSVNFRVRNVTSNLTAYSGLQRYAPAIAVNPVGFLSNVSCAAYTNSTNLICPVSYSGVVSCYFTNFVADEFINITPYCMDDGYSNATSKVLEFRYGYLDQLRLKVYDESNGTFITQNVTVRLTSTTNDKSYTFTTGQYNITTLTDLPYGNYSVRFNSSYPINYTTRFYNYQISTPNIQDLNAFLIPTSINQITIFTIKDSISSNIIPGASINQYSFVNGQQYLVNTINSDISGKAQINYIADTQYSFVVTKLGYSNNNFPLDPILLTAYDILLTEAQGLNNSANYQGITFYYNPSQFIDGQSNQFDLAMFSPYGTLQGYGFALTVPNGSQYISLGSNPYGSVLSTVFPLSNTTPGLSTVRIDYFYATEATGQRNFTLYLPILYNETTTINMDNHFGMTVFERILLATFIVLITVGIASLIGQVIPGFVLGMVQYIYLTAIDFIPLWAVLPGIFIAFLLVAWRTGGT